MQTGIRTGHVDSALSSATTETSPPLHFGQGTAGGQRQENDLTVTETNSLRILLGFWYVAVATSEHINPETGDGD